MDPNLYKALSRSAVADHDIEMDQHLRRMRARAPHAVTPRWRAIRFALPGFAWFARLQSARRV